MLKNLKKYLDEEKKTINWLEGEAGISKGTLAKALKNDTVIGYDKILKICAVLPDLNIRWLLLNSGDMRLERFEDDSGVNYREKAEWYNLELAKRTNECQILKARIIELEIVVKYLESKT